MLLFGVFDDVNGFNKTIDNHICYFLGSLMMSMRSTKVCTIICNFFGPLMM